jgi:hypothetical protein
MVRPEGITGPCTFGSVMLSCVPESLRERRGLCLFQTRATSKPSTSSHALPPTITVTGGAANKPSLSTSQPTLRRTVWRAAARIMNRSKIMLGARRCVRENFLEGFVKDMLPISLLVKLQKCYQALAPQPR